MKKSRKYIIAVIVCSVITLLFFKASNLNFEKDNKPKTEDTQKTVYTLKDYNGKIAVFENSSSKPTAVYDTPLVSELPIEDRKKLLNGIPVYSKKELTLLLQDYDI